MDLISACSENTGCVGENTGCVGCHLKCYVGHLQVALPCKSSALLGNSLVVDLIAVESSTSFSVCASGDLFKNQMDINHESCPDCQCSSALSGSDPQNSTLPEG